MIALIVASEVMAGALVLKVVRKIDFGRVFSRVMLVEGDALKKCLKLKNHLARKTDIFADFDCEMYLRYYAICIKPEYRKKGKKKRFLWGVGKKKPKPICRFWAAVDEKRTIFSEILRHFCGNGNVFQSQITTASYKNWNEGCSFCCWFKFPLLRIFT